MKRRIGKIGTLLISLAFLASMLAVVTPVGADDSRVVDVYVAEIQVDGGASATPSVGDNITITATIQAVDENATDVMVTFEAVNGTTTMGLAMVDAGENVTNSTPLQVAGWWDSNENAPDPNLVYDIKVTVQQAGDANTTNDTLVLEDAVDWKAPLLGVTEIAGDAEALIGDMYTATVTVKNFGDADFEGIQVVDVVDSGGIVGTAELNTTGSPMAPDATEDVAVEINTTDFSEGEVNLSADLNGYSDYILVTFIEPMPNVYVDGIIFNPASNVVKHTQTVTITATLMNNGTADFNGTVTFKEGDDASNELGVVEDVEVPMGTDGVDVAFDWMTPASMETMEHLIWVVPEIGETANETLIVLPQPHTVLGVSGIAFNPTTLDALEDVGAEQNVTVTVTVTNTGDAPAENATVTLMADGVDVATEDITLIAGAQEDVEFTYVASTSEDDAEVNISAKIMKDEDMASHYKMLTVPGDIDTPAFEITDVSVTPSTQERSMDVEVTVTVKNIGDALADEVMVKVMAGTTDIGDATLMNISADGGENTTEAITWTIPASFETGTVAINATIDGHEDVYLFENLTIIEFKKPELEISFEKKNDKVKKYSGEAEEGSKDTVKVKVIINNTGNADAKNVMIVVKDKKGEELANATVATIPAGDSHEQEIPIKMKAGESTKLTAEATYDGVHDDSYGPVTTSEQASVDIEKVPGFEAVIFAGAVAVALVVLSRRRK